MDSKELINKLRLMAATIEELEIDNIISCEIDSDHKMRVHVIKLKVTPPDEAIWKERFDLSYNWAKTFTHNNICFFSLYTQEEYVQERKLCTE